MNDMHIKETLLSPACPGTGCSKNGTQCLNISQPVTLQPSTTVGTLSVSCQGTPTLTCENNADGTACIVTLTQNVCVTIPVSYDVKKDSGAPVISCAGDRCKL